ncbi:MAG: pyrophosphatase PpaX [Caulobacteraceae bacterium]
MKYKYILFDLDGTLIDTNKLILDSFKHTYRKHLGREVEEAEILKYFGEPLIDTLRRYSEENAEEMFKTYIEFNEAQHDSSVSLCGNIKELLKELKKSGCVMAVVTSKRRKIAVRGLELFDIRKYFDLEVTLEDTELHKPNPAPVLKALELLGSKPEEALMIGDSIFDIHCAHGAGVKAVLVKWSAAKGHQEESDAADYVINETCELVNIVK